MTDKGQGELGGHHLEHDLTDESCCAECQITLYASRGFLGKVDEGLGGEFLERQFLVGCQVMFNGYDGDEFFPAELVS